jgi:hypothetical protein
MSIAGASEGVDMNVHQHVADVTCLFEGEVFLEGEAVIGIDGTNHQHSPFTSRLPQPRPDRHHSLEYTPLGLDGEITWRQPGSRSRRDDWHACAEHWRVVSRIWPL